MSNHHTRVLVIDDHRASLTALQALLLDEGYLVDTAVTGPESLALARVRPPHVVLTDPSAPGMIGIRLWHELSPGLPVIVVTASATSTSGKEALRAGAEDYMAKPLDFAALLLSIERAIHIHAAARKQPYGCAEAPC